MSTSAEQVFICCKLLLVTSLLQAFKNLKGRANSAYIKRMQYMAGTGGGEAAENVNLGLSDVYARCNKVVLLKQLATAQYPILYRYIENLLYFIYFLCLPFY